MMNYILRKCLFPANKIHGTRGVEKYGHREYVGGLWEELGQLQFDFLVSHGLKPYHRLIDIGCGALRGGVKFIEYLNDGCYTGVDKEKQLVYLGLQHELNKEVFELRHPSFIITNSFDFSPLLFRQDFAIAQSLFTHLPEGNIRQCLANLRQHMKQKGCFFATFFESNVPKKNPRKAHDHGSFFYTKEQMLDFGVQNEWGVEYIGNWNHPRNQVMVKYAAE